MGDEFLHGWETSDGYTIIFDSNLNRWTYATTDERGFLISSGLVVGKDNPEKRLPKYVRPKGEALKKVIQKRQERDALILKEEPLPLRLKRKNHQTSTIFNTTSNTTIANLLVVLVNFNDTSPRFNRTDFHNLLFSTGNYSLRDYYYNVSYGKFSVSPGPSGIQGWFRVSKNRCYYGNNSGDDKDVRVKELVTEVLRILDNRNFNFAPYDQDGDCVVDALTVIHVGKGEEQHPHDPCDIWSHMWSVDYTTKTRCPSDLSKFIKVREYTIQPELLGNNLTTIGVFAHEYGHILDLPDLYDTDYSSEGIGRWSLMASGNWNAVNKSGDRPAFLDAWSRYKLGWVNVVGINLLINGNIIEATSPYSVVYKLLSGTPDSGEYFLVENRQRVGFDAGLPGDGLLIWHIDASKRNNNQECYPGGPNCKDQHYKVRLVQADNRWDLEKGANRGDSGDPYPGSSNNRIFNRNSSPSSQFYNGTAGIISVRDISNSSSGMTATLYSGYPLGLSLYRPNGGEIYSAGRNATIYWVAPLNSYKFELYYSTDNKTTWRYISNHTISRCVRESNIFICNKTWTIPPQDKNTRQSFVRVRAYNNTNNFIGRDDSDRPFTIEVLKLLRPNGGEVLRVGSNYTIAWNTYALQSAVVKTCLWYICDNMGTRIALIDGNPGFYQWTVPNRNSNKCRVTVELLNANNQVIEKDVSDQPFSIIP